MVTASIMSRCDFKIWHTVGVAGDDIMFHILVIFGSCSNDRKSPRDKADISFRKTNRVSIYSQLHLSRHTQIPTSSFLNGTHTGGYKAMGVFLIISNSYLYSSSQCRDVCNMISALQWPRKGPVAHKLCPWHDVILNRVMGRLDQIMSMVSLNFIRQ